MADYKPAHAVAYSDGSIREPTRYERQLLEEVERVRLSFEQSERLQNTWLKEQVKLKPKAKRAAA